MKKILYVLLFIAVMIGIQPIMVSGGWRKERGKDEQSSVTTKVGFLYRNVVFEKHPLKVSYEKEIKKLQGEYENFHKDLASNPEVKKVMEEVQSLIDELQLLEQGTEDYGKKEEEINNKKKAFEPYLKIVAAKEDAITAKQREFNLRFENDLGKVASEIGKEKNISLIVSMLAHGYDSHKHGDQTEFTPSYNYLPYKKEGTESLDLTREFIHKLEIMHKFRMDEQ